MEAVKSTLNKILHPHSSSTDSSATEAAPSATSTPHNDSKAHQERSLSEATKDLSLNDDKSDATTGEPSLSVANAEQLAHSTLRVSSRVRRQDDHQRPRAPQAERC